ncbi:site-specific DNA-methyltransferase, partial [bacterium]|nr:site-specific DNA-methyltransferase [bacterium]
MGKQTCDLCMIFYSSKQFTLYNGDSKQILPTMAENSIDSVVCDPPYELGFMGKSWDCTGIANDVQLWKEVLRVLKPGGHLLAFSGSRTYHRMAVAIEDAGFEIRDQIMWVYGSGFPKSHDVSKAIDKAAGAEREVVGETRKGAQSESTGRYGAWGDGITPTAPATAAAKQWQGWGTALKPAHEPIVLARKPVKGTVANNVLTYGVGGINIDGTRVGSEGGSTRGDKPS